MFLFSVLSFLELSVSFSVKPKAGEKEVSPNTFFSIWHEFSTDFKEQWKKQNKLMLQERWEYDIILETEAFCWQDTWTHCPEIQPARDIGVSFLFCVFGKSTPRSDLLNVITDTPVFLC